MTKGAHRVRFTHLGVPFEGQLRPACRPDKATMAMTGNIKKVDCHACKMAMDDFFALMEEKKAKGELPDDLTGKRVWKKEHRDTSGNPVTLKVHPNRRARLAAAKRKK